VEGAVLNMNLRIVSVILILLFSFAALLAHNTYAQNSIDLGSKAKTLVSALTGLNATAASALKELELAGSNTSETAREVYLEGNSFAQQAFNFFKEGNYAMANSSARAGMEKFQQVLKIADAALYDATGFVNSAETYIKLKAQLSRVTKYLDEIASLAAVAKARGFNVTLVQEMIDSTRVLVESGLEKIDRLDENGAMQLLWQAKGIVDQLTAMQTRLSIEIKRSRIEAYVVQAEQRVDYLRANITAVTAAVPTSVQVASLSALNQASASLDSARNFLDTGKINQTVSSLNAFRIQEQRSISILQAAGINVTVQNTDEPASSAENTRSPTNASNSLEATKAPTSSNLGSAP
jgi:hypothetical protein